eukprot:560338-Prymnesium_polylepis.1
MRHAASRKQPVSCSIPSARPASVHGVPAACSSPRANASREAARPATAVTWSSSCQRGGRGRGGVACAAAR